MRKTSAAAVLSTVLVGVLCGCTPKSACADEPSAVAVVIPHPHEFIRNFEAPTHCG